MRRGTTGIRDLARDLNIAVSTVSRAMNGGEVSEATRVLVRERAAALGYTPNQSGRNLRRGATHTVALTVRTDTGRTAAGETFFLRLCQGLQPVLADHELDLVILPCGSAAEQDRYLRRAVDRHMADGFIISDTQRVDPRIDFLIEREVPFVALGRSESGGRHSWIDLDSAAAAQAAVDHLVALGHRRIALGTIDRDVYTATVFQAGYEAALRRHRLPVDPALVLVAPDTLEGGDVLFRHWQAMPARATALLLVQETMAVALYRQLAAAGLAPGRDLAVIGYRANPVTEFLSPPLTCFDVSLGEYGARIGALIADRIAGGPPRQEVWPMSLHPGASDRRPDVADRTAPGGRP